MEGGYEINDEISLSFFDHPANLYFFSVRKTNIGLFYGCLLDCKPREKSRQR